MVLWQAVFVAASPLVTAPSSNLTRLFYNGSSAKSHSTTTKYRQLRRLTYNIIWSCYLQYHVMSLQKTLHIKRTSCTCINSWWLEQFRWINLVLVVLKNSIVHKIYKYTYIVIRVGGLTLRIVPQQSNLGCPLHSGEFLSCLQFQVLVSN